MNVSQIVERLQESSRLKNLLAKEGAVAIEKAANAVTMALASGGKVLIFGNGGSAADAQHIAAEFVGRFGRDRRSLPAIALTTDTSILTAIGNDYGFEQIFARQVHALGKPSDVVIAISTSGSSPNILAGVKIAKEMGLTIIGLTGAGGMELARLADIPVVVPSKNAARIQECHITIGHLFCEAVETTLEMGKSFFQIRNNQSRLNKVKQFEELLALCKRWRTEKKTVVWTNGCFDLLHLGHVKNLQAAKALGDILMVGVNSDDSVRKLKGPLRPVVSALERAEILAALECVDYVVIFEELTPEKILGSLKPDVHCKGGDYAKYSGKQIPEIDVVKAYGGRIEVLPFLPGHSTSKLVQHIQEMKK